MSNSTKNLNTRRRTASKTKKRVGSVFKFDDLKLSAVEDIEDESALNEQLKEF